VKERILYFRSLCKCVVYQAIHDYPNPNPNCLVPELSRVNKIEQISGAIFGIPNYL
jgi:hypothetical protein